MKNGAILAAAVGILSLLCMGADAPKVYKPDNDGFIHNWIILEPIALEGVDHVEAVEKPMFDKQYFKDQLTVLPKAEDKAAIGGKDFKWHEFKADDFLVDLAQFATDHTKDSDSCLFWGITYVVAPDEIKDVKLAIGSDDSSVWWVNGKEVIRVYESRQVNQDDNVSKPLILRKGVNILRFAVIQGDGPTGACARFLDAKDKPVPNLTVALEPPAAPATAPVVK